MPSSKAARIIICLLLLIKKKGAMIKKWLLSRRTRAAKQGSGAGSLQSCLLKMRKDIEQFFHDDCFSPVPTRSSNRNASLESACSATEGPTFAPDDRAIGRSMCSGGHRLVTTAHCPDQRSMRAWERCINSCSQSGSSPLQVWRLPRSPEVVVRAQRSWHGPKEINGRLPRIAAQPRPAATLSTCLRAVMESGPSMEGAV